MDHRLIFLDIDGTLPVSYTHLDVYKRQLQFSLEPLSHPAALLSGETVLWYNAQFRARLLNGQDVLVSRVQKVMPGDVYKRQRLLELTQRLDKGCQLHAVVGGAVVAAAQLFFVNFAVKTVAQHGTPAARDVYKRQAW